MVKIISLLLIIALLLVIKFCKKIVRTILSIIIILLTLYCFIISTDMNRVNNFKEPKFAVVKKENDLSMKTVTYQGLGYRVEVVKDLSNDKIEKIEMYMFGKVIAGAVE